MMERAKRTAGREKGTVTVMLQSTAGKPLQDLGSTVGVPDPHLFSPKGSETSLGEELHLQVQLVGREVLFLSLPRSLTKKFLIGQVVPVFYFHLSTSVTSG